MPENSKFNIISFGTNSTKMFTKSQDYNNEEILQTVIEKVQKFEANLGGTELQKPIASLLKQECDPTTPRSIFLITDGGIKNPQIVVRNVKNNSNNTRVFTFGIGSDCSVQLVKELAKAGGGIYNFVSDDETNLNAKVIRSLKVASKPAFTDIKIDWKKNSDAVIFCNPNQNVPINIFEEDTMHILATLDKSILLKSDIEIEVFNTLKQRSEKLIIKLDPKVTLSDPSCTAFKISAYDQIDYLNALVSKSGTIH